jgi:hypothetical protein
MPKKKKVWRHEALTSNPSPIPPHPLTKKRIENGDNKTVYTLHWEL